MPDALRDLVEKVLAGDRRAMARAISTVEDKDPLAVPLLKELFTWTGRALVVGITGSPGAGKSTLVEKLAKEHRRAGARVGILAVDPTSPFSGAPSWVIASGCKASRTTQASIFAAWPRVANSAGWLPRPTMPSPFLTRPVAKWF